VVRSLTVIFSLIVFSNAICIAQPSRAKLPKPDNEIINDLTLEKGFKYLESNFKKQGQRKILQKFKDCKSDCECSWMQTFRRGVEYSIDECREAGYVVKIAFKNYGKSEVTNLVNQLFKTQENRWNQEMTKYYPPTGEPGCSYEIFVEKETVILEYYCGC
jgi:hypothetical protein